VATPTLQQTEGATHRLTLRSHKARGQAKQFRVELPLNSTPLSIKTVAVLAACLNIVSVPALCEWKRPERLILHYPRYVDLPSFYGRLAPLCVRGRSDLPSSIFFLFVRHCRHKAVQDASPLRTYDVVQQHKQASGKLKWRRVVSWIRRDVSYQSGLKTPKDSGINMPYALVSVTRLTTANSPV
jgi:hypothetical protein